jgi:hypothetical protein
VWYRVFATGDTTVEPAALMEYLCGLDADAKGHFRGDAHGWFRAELTLGGEGRVELERYLTEEEGIRAQLNTWAAWLEAAPPGPNRERLLLHLGTARQVFTLLPEEGDEAVAQICERLCRFLADRTAGVVQADGHGFSDADGTPLLPES